MKRNNKKGFTIVELVIVIAAIAILTAVLIPTFSNVIKRAKESNATQMAKTEYELYLSEYSDKETMKENLYIKVQLSKTEIYWFKVEDRQFNATKLEIEPSDKENDDLTTEPTVKAYTKTTDSTDPATVDGFYTNKNCEAANKVSGDLSVSEDPYYYRAYVIEDQNPKVEIYAKTAE